jgi:hypothetical protein
MFDRPDRLPPRRVSLRMFLIGLAAVSALTVIVGTWLGPGAVRAAYRGEGFFPFTSVITGQIEHPESYYVDRWLALARFGALGLAVVFSVGFFVLVRGVRLTTAVGIALCVLWGLASLTFPFGWDQGIFAAIGDATVRGGMPYRDGWDMKGPLAFQAYALAQALFGRTMWGIRVLDLPLLIAACWSLSRLTSSLTTKPVGFWSGVALLLWLGTLGYFRQSQPDGWVAMLMVLGVYALLSPNRPVAAGGRYGAMGFLIGLSLLVKPTFGAFLLIPLVTGLIQRRDAPAGWIWKAGAATLVGSLAPVVATLLWFTTQGALQDLIDVHLVYSASVYAAGAPIGLSRRVLGALRFFWRGEFAVVLPLVFFGAWSLWRTSRSTALIVFAWFTAGFLGVVVQGRFFLYHWLPVFPPTVLFGAYGLWTLSRLGLDSASGTGGREGRALAVVAAACVLLSLAVVPSRDVTAWAKRVTGLIPPEQYYDDFDRPTDRFVAGNDLRAAAHIRANTDEGEAVGIFGYNATIPYLSGRPLASRFVFSLPLLVDGRFKAPYRAEFVRDLRNNHAAYIIVGNSPRGSKERDMERFPELTDLLGERYVLERSFGYVDLYRLRASARAPRPRP